MLCFSFHFWISKPLIKTYIAVPRFVFINCIYGNKMLSVNEIMKRYILTFCAFVALFFASAQNDITQFLGIPIDGTKSELMSKIKKKGFKKTKFADGTVLTGRFNDTDVNIDVATNGDRAYRVIVWDSKPSNERMIKIRYNNLCYQLKNNDKYLSQEDWSIPDNEDISYEMKANGKSYQAVFFQWPTEIGDSIIHDQTLADITLRTLSGELSNLSEDERHNEIEKVYLKRLSDLSSNKRVWFTILEQEYDKYVIVMNYENVYNLNNGRDL